MSAGAVASSTQDDLSFPSRRFIVTLGAVLLVGLAWRVGYVVAQPAVDPWFAEPGFDGAYYVNWARALVGGAGGPEGAFYLAPLYPHLLALFLAVCGERLGLLYMSQHLLVLATAGLIGLTARRKLGEGAALSSAVLFLLYPPLLYFASRPLSETVALFFMFAALGTAWRETPRSAFASGSEPCSPRRAWLWCCCRSPCATSSSRGTPFPFRPTGASPHTTGTVRAR
jgi:4-amino-4-deoxy-L-arabinose transferase-like glycosyltransferase